MVKIKKIARKINAITAITYFYWLKTIYTTAYQHKSSTRAIFDESTYYVTSYYKVSLQVIKFHFNANC